MTYEDGIEVEKSNPISSLEPSVWLDEAKVTDEKPSIKAYRNFKKILSLTDEI